ncbi:MAG: IS110 family transposase [Gammaproteobacteria bacterium]|nr:IS110 family transposase [Gammaproteobacteria bacterium]
MNKIKQFYGIDISKDVFDVVDHEDNHHQYSNDQAGFKEFRKILTKQSHCVLEVTGSYYQGLATWLHTKSIDVSVVNPLSVKRFIQMRLKTSKTDKADARMIRLYSEAEKPDLWQPPSEYIIEANELHRLIALLLRQRTALKNKLHGLKAKGFTKSSVVSSVRRQIRNLDHEVSTLEEKLEEVVKEHQADLITRLCSIPGIGKRTAIYLIVITQGFEKFETSRQLISYLGLDPTIHESGSSVRGKSRISKTGNNLIRNLLFMCSFTACKHNKSCREIYQRIIAKGKSKKLALIAVANKLLKQSLAIAKSGLYYDENFRSMNLNNV